MPEEDGAEERRDDDRREDRHDERAPVREVEDEVFPDQGAEGESCMASPSADGR
jgi:hypothetical protein